MASSTETIKLRRYFVASVTLLAVTIFWNLVTLNLPFPGALYYLLAFLVALVICSLTLLRKFRFLNALIIIDVLLLAAGIIVDRLFAPPFMM